MPALLAATPALPKILSGPSYMMRSLILEDRLWVLQKSCNIFVRRKVHNLIFPLYKDGGMSGGMTWTIVGFKLDLFLYLNSRVTCHFHRK